jgi:hypothetical protein
MDRLKSRFRLDRSVRNSATQASPITSASPADNCFTFRAYDDPSPSTLPAGSFESDIASSEYQQCWETWTDFENWIVQEQRSKGIELHLVNTYLGLPEFERKLRYVCSRAGTGGLKTYVKRHPDWNRKIENKRTDCKCRLLVKQYPGISTILGSYRDEHDHALRNIAPVSFVNYLKKYWMLEKVVRMWSGLYRTERDIFEACDTNMLIEAYVLGYHLPSLSSF